MSQTIEEKKRMDSGNGRTGRQMRTENRENSCPGGDFARVGKAQSLEKLAAAYGVTPEELLEANPYLRPERMVPGQVVVIPGQEGKAWKGPVKKMEYIMKDTDTLGDILRKFDISILQLRRLNPGRDVFSLGAGDAIDVPVWPETSLEDGYYILGAGDTLAGTAQKFGTSVMELLRANPNLRPQEFCAGQRIALPRRRSYAH